MNKRRWLITVAACVVLLAALASYKYLQIKAAIAYGESFPEPSATVEAIRVQTSPSVDSVSTIGEVVAPQAITLRNELEGRIVAVNFEAGARIKAGDLLIQLDISEEKARLKAAEARLKLAHLDLDRVQKLLHSRTVSEERVDQARAEYDVAQANIDALRAAIDKKTIRAPFAARAGLHDLEVGEYLQANTLLTNLVGINDFTWADFNLPYHYTGVSVGNEVQASIAGADQPPISGLIIASDTAVSSQSRTLRFRARLNANISPNTLVNIRVSLGRSEKIQVPITALLHDALGNFVYVLEEDNDNNGYRARRQPVETGAQGDQLVVIENGLQAGTRIATQGAFKLRSGLLVFIGERPQTVSSPAAAVNS